MSFRRTIRSVHPIPHTTTYHLPPTLHTHYTSSTYTGPGMECRASGELASAPHPQVGTYIPAHRTVRHAVAPAPALHMGIAALLRHPLPAFCLLLSGKMHRKYCPQPYAENPFDRRRVQESRQTSDRPRPRMDTLDRWDPRINSFY